MGMDWETSVRLKKQLSVFGTPRLMQSASWGPTLLKRMLDEFNRLSTSNKMEVQLVPTTTPPDPNNTSGANVQVDLSNGVHSFVFEGKTHTRTMDPAPSIAGMTHPISRGFVLRAFIFLPEQPQTGSRDIGDGVKIALGLHELLHAAGLDETDTGHTGGAQADLFMSGATLSPGRQPDGSGDHLVFSTGRQAPPFFVNAKTAEMVRKLWN